MRGQQKQGPEIAIPMDTMIDVKGPDMYIASIKAIGPLLSMTIPHVSYVLIKGIDSILDQCIQGFRLVMGLGKRENLHRKPYGCFHGFSPHFIPRGFRGQFPIHQSSETPNGMRKKQLWTGYHPWRPWRPWS